MIVVCNFIIMKFSIFSLFFFIYTINISSFADESHNDFFQCLQLNSVSSLTFTQKNSSYQTLFRSPVKNLRAIYTHKLRPIAIITPLEESQIPPIITCSKLCGIEIRTRSGGHDNEGLSYVSESTFIVLDLRNLISITIDAEKKTGWAQSGATLGELYYAIGNTSRTLAFPAGLCPTVCLGGHLSGGGYGMISRKFGLSIDHIIDARIVDVNGRILDRESMGEDLFWAIRGGGGASFGVILAWKINLVIVPETVTVFSLTRTSEQNLTNLVHKHLQIADKMDDEVVVRLSAKSIYDKVKRSKTIQVKFKALYLGGVENLLHLMQENFPELGLVRKDCIEMSWIDSCVNMWPFPVGSTPEVLLNRGDDSDSGYYGKKGKSDIYTEPIPKEGLLGVWDRIHERTDNFALEITPFGGRMNEISESELPFPHRLGTRYMIHNILQWKITDTVKKDDALNMKWINDLYTYVRPYASKNPRGAYFNFRDLDLGSDDEDNISNTKGASIWGIKYFKNNFERLVQVKTKVDPTNFFRNEQSIPVSQDIKEVIEKNAGRITV